MNSHMSYNTFVGTFEVQLRHTTSIILIIHLFSQNFTKEQQVYHTSESGRLLTGASKYIYDMISQKGTSTYQNVYWI